MKIVHIINEGLSSILYHSTSLSTVSVILSSNRFRLTADIGSDTEIKFRDKDSDKIYYMSFSRSKMGEYHLKYINSQNSHLRSLLVLDGDLLSNRYSGKSINYFDDYTEGSMEYIVDEMEDRIYSKKPYIENAINYIHSIHVYVDRNILQGEELSLLRQCYISCKRSGIKFYVYADIAAYRLLDIRRVVSLSSLSTGVGKKSNSDIIFHTSSESDLLRVYSGLMELLSVSDINRVRIGKELLSVLDDNLLRDFVNNSQFDSLSRRNLEKFLSKAGSFGLYSIGDIVQYIREKFK